MTVIWHNPRCSKSRQTLALIEDRAPDVRRYLDDAPSEAELRRVLQALNLPTRAILRKGEAIAKELSLKDASDDALIAAMVQHPILIERPIVIHGDKAAIGRPPEAVLDLFA